MTPQVTEPPARTHRAMSFMFPEYLAQYIDSRAERLCCSRAAFLRRLVLEDMEQAQKAAPGSAS